jgi:hypothetical protein
MKFHKEDITEIRLLSFVKISINEFVLAHVLPDLGKIQCERSVCGAGQHFVIVMIIGTGKALVFN